jgi:glutamate dehydrogenase/leucine dehydrogenase
MSQGEPYKEAMQKLETIYEIAKNLPKELANITKEGVEILKQPQRTLIVNFPVKTEKGTKIINGYRVQYNDALGPTKGGIRYHHEVDQNEVKALAFWMALKNSLLELPYGGGKGGITINPKEFHKHEIEEISREFIRQIHFFIGPKKDIPAPDVYTNPQIMGYMMDEFQKIKGEHLPGVITGKPIEIGGSKGRSYSTAMGGFYVLREIADEKGLQPKNTKVAIHGFGNAGMNMAQILSKEGYKVVSVSDSKGGIYNPEGLDVEKVTKHKEETGSVTGFKDAKDITGEEVVELDVDVLVPASLSGLITKNNAPNVKAKIIVELANGPITHEADKILNEKEIIVLPDILANAGGVTVSYFEWMQNLQGDKWSEEEVLDKLDKRMTRAVRDLYEKYVVPHKLDFRTAAYLKAIARIVQAEKDRGRIR